jgi:hypothetical protein
MGRAHWGVRCTVVVWPLGPGMRGDTVRRWVAPFPLARSWAADAEQWVLGGGCWAAVLDGSRAGRQPCWTAAVLDGSRAGRHGVRGRLPCWAGRGCLGCGGAWAQSGRCCACAGGWVVSLSWRGVWKAATAGAYPDGGGGRWASPWHGRGGLLGRGLPACPARFLSHPVRRWPRCPALSGGKPVGQITPDRPTAGPDRRGSTTPKASSAPTPGQRSTATTTSSTTRMTLWVTPTGTALTETARRRRL